MSEYAKHVERELAKLRRRDGKHPVEVGKVLRAAIANGVHTTAAWREQNVILIEITIVAELLNERLPANLPAAPEPRIQTQVKLHVLRGATIHQIVIPPGAIEEKFGRKHFEACTLRTQSGEALRRGEIGYAGTRDESALRIEVVTDRAGRVSRVVVAPVSRGRQVPERRANRFRAAPRCTAGQLPLRGYDAAHDATINAEYAVPVCAVNFVGVGESHATGGAQIALHAHDGEDGQTITGTRRLSAVDGRQHADVEALMFTGELGGRHWLADAPRVDQLTGRRELFLTFQKERTTLGEKNGASGIVLKLGGVGLDLREIGIGRTGQREIAGNAPAGTATYLGT